MSRGKKIGVLTVTLDRAVRKHYGQEEKAKFQIDLRLDISTGTFYACHDGEWYDAKTQAQLAAQIKKAVETTIDVTWTRYLIVDYNATGRTIDDDTKRPDTNYSSTYDLTADRSDLAGKRFRRGVHQSRRDRPQVITGIDLIWTVIEYSSPFMPPENRSKLVRMTRTVHYHRDDDDQLCESFGEPDQQADDNLPAGAVPWTVEREAFLHQILATLGKLDARLVELFGGASDDLAKKIDAAAQLDPSRLLAAPAPPVKAKRARP